MKRKFWADMKNPINLHCLELDQTSCTQSIFCGPHKKKKLNKRVKINYIYNHQKDANKKKFCIGGTLNLLTNADSIKIPMIFLKIFCLKFDK